MDTEIKEIGTGILYVKQSEVYYVDARRNWKLVRDPDSKIKTRKRYAGHGEKTVSHTEAPEGIDPSDLVIYDADGERRPALEDQRSTEPEEDEAEGVEENVSDESETTRTVLELSHIDWSESQDPTELLDSITT